MKKEAKPKVIIEKNKIRLIRIGSYEVGYTYRFEKRQKDSAGTHYWQNIYEHYYLIPKHGDNRTIFIRQVNNPKCNTLEYVLGCILSDLDD